MKCSQSVLRIVFKLLESVKVIDANKNEYGTFNETNKTKKVYNLIQ